jgi:tetratricopeptide (TPR) repeat protein
MITFGSCDPSPVTHPGRYYSISNRPEKWQKMRQRSYGTAVISGVLLFIILAWLVLPAGADPNATPSGTPIGLSGPDIDAINAYNQGADLASLGNYSGALQATEKALSLQPNFSLAWTQEAGLLVVLGRDNEAVSAADKAIAGNPNISEAWSNRADALNNLGRYQEALQSANQAITLDPTLKAAKDSKNLAEAMLAQGTQVKPVTTTKSAAFSSAIPVAGMMITGFLLFYGRKRI